MSSKSRRTGLYRAVTRAEADSIRALGAFVNTPGLEAKYFAATLEGAVAYARKADARFRDGPYMIVKTTIATGLIGHDMRLLVDGGIPTVVLPTGLLVHLTRPETME